MTAPTRYAGRFDGPGVSDDLPGPATIERLFAGHGVIIEDPVSFPWYLLDDDQQREPVLVDLSRCTDDDLTALLPQLGLLTPSDRIIATSGQREALMAHLALPDSAFLSDRPDDAGALLTPLVEEKVVAHLLRSGLEPILERELGSGGSGAPQRVHQVGGRDSWLKALVPDPHRFSRSDRADRVGSVDGVDPESVEVLIVATDAIDLEGLPLAAARLTAGGLLIFLLDRSAVATAAAPTMRQLVEALRKAFGAQFVFERIWGLHERPGRPTLGAIVAVRPLGSVGVAA